MAGLVHGANYCMDNFYQLAAQVTHLYNTGQQWNALLQLSNCWQARAVQSRSYGTTNQGHWEAIKAVQNLWSFLKDNAVTAPLQIAYSEPKTFSITTQAIGYIGQVSAYGFRDSQGNMYPMQGGKRVKRKGTRKARKSRKSRKTRARK